MATETEVVLCADDELKKTKNFAKIVFEPEDCPPLSWYERNHIQPPQKQHDDVIKIGTKEIQRSEWVKAPEFVPRKAPSKQQTSSDRKESDRGSLPNIFVNPRFGDRPFPVIQQQPLSTRPPVHRVLQQPFLPAPLLPIPPGATGIPNPHQIRAMMRFPMVRPTLLHATPGRPLRPFGPNIFASRPFNSALGRDTGFPQGYTANVTAINAGIGPPIPAIVLKKKRKKRRKNKSKSAIFSDEAACSDTTGSPKPIDGPSLDDLDDMTSSSSGSALLANQRRSEPDLTKLSHTQASSPKLGSLRSRQEENNRRTYPNDLDLIQSALEHGQVSMASSCPDLSEAQKELLEELWEIQEEHVDYATRLPRTKVQAEESPPNPPPESEPAPDLELKEFDVSSPPISSAIQAALEAKEGKITSAAVKELDKQIISEMSLPRALHDSQNYDEDEDEDDQIFDRLLKAQENDNRIGINCGGPGKSLFEEIEEKQLLFPDRAPVHVAVVHGKNGANTMLLNGQGNRDKFTQQTVDALFPGLATSDDEQDPIHITVNTFEDPEELVLDDIEPMRGGGRFSQIRQSLKGLKRSKSLEFPLYPSKSEVCSCSVM